jgi:hypothetical protein
MGMNHKRVYDRIVASYATGIRGDLDIADFQKLDGITAHVLVEFEPNIGKPSSDDVERYFHKMFEGRIVPIMSSMSVKPLCVSILAQANIPTRPIEDTQDATKMTAVVAGLMYLDNDLQQVWNVKEDGEGKKVLAKESKENIEQIIAARRNRMFVTKTPNVSLASVASVRELLTAGCTVKAWHEGKVQALEIVEPVKGGFKVKTEAGKEAVVAKEGVIDLQKMAADAPKEDAALIKYYSEAYGDKKFATDLVKAK